MIERQSRALKTRMIAMNPQKIEPKNDPLGWRPGPRKVGQKTQNTPLVTSPQENCKLESKLEDLLNP